MVINKKGHTVQGSSFFGLGFSRGVTDFCGSKFAMTYKYFRISKTNIETSMEYLQKVFPQSPILLFSGTDH